MKTASAEGWESAKSAFEKADGELADSWDRLPLSFRSQERVSE